MPSRLSQNSPALSSRAQRGICFLSIQRTALLLAGLLFSVSCPAQEAPKRPSIVGIANVGIALPHYSADFYSKSLGFNTVRAVQTGALSISTFAVNPHQSIDLIDADAIDPLTRKVIESKLTRVTFETSDIEELQRYLESRGVRTSKLTLDSDAGWFSVDDPEGHAIAFAQFKRPYRYPLSERQVSTHIIHAGFVVHDRAATDHFYKDILGFRPYWHGGMKDDKDDWVAMQVPDGTDWIEYMLNIPLDADKKLLGVMNHIALGVTDIQAAKARLLKNGATLTEEPKLGRDGKWQLNLYDPDDTRIEFMEFTPKEKPCCSEFTGPHPKP